MYLLLLLLLTTGDEVIKFWNVKVGGRRAKSLKNYKWLKKYGLGCKLPVYSIQPRRRPRTYFFNHL